MSNIYVLRLTDNKYYVGKTNRHNVDLRFAEHLSGNIKAAFWTIRYPPIEVLETRECKSLLDEDTVTKEYMFKHGIENVRGGIYVQENLSIETINHLKKIFDGAKGNCHNCGQDGHWVNECKTATTTTTRTTTITMQPPIIIYQSPARRRRNTITQSSRFYYHRFSPYGRNCFRCGRSSHFVADCFATTHINGFQI